MTFPGLSVGDRFRIPAEPNFDFIVEDIAHHGIAVRALAPFGRVHTFPLEWLANAGVIVVDAPSKPTPDSLWRHCLDEEECDAGVVVADGWLDVIPTGGFPADPETLRRLARWLEEVAEWNQ